MGYILKAKCKCGLNKELSIGGGILNHHIKEDFPCYCSNCKSNSTRKFKRVNMICPECVKRGVLP